MASPLRLIIPSYAYHVWSIACFCVIKYGHLLPYAISLSRLVPARILLVLYASQDLNSNVFHSIRADRTMQMYLSFGRRLF